MLGNVTAGDGVRALLTDTLDGHDRLLATVPELLLLVSDQDLVPEARWQSYFALEVVR